VALGDDPKVAWLAERSQLDRTNRRISAGAACWQSTVETYAKGG
jgi:hypothetical protein